MLQWNLSYPKNTCYSPENLAGTSWKLITSHWRSWCLPSRLPQSFITRFGFHDCKTAVSRVDGNCRNGATGRRFQISARIHIPTEMKFLSSFTTLNGCDTFCVASFFLLLLPTLFPVEPSAGFCIWQCHRVLPALHLLHLGLFSGKTARPIRTGAGCFQWGERQSKASHMNLLGIHGWEKRRIPVISSVVFYSWNETLQRPHAMMEQHVVVDEV